MRAVLTPPACPNIARQTIDLEDRSKKKGIVKRAKKTAFVPFDLQPFASQSANGKAKNNSINVTVTAIRIVLNATSKRPDSNSDIHVFKDGS